MYTNTLCRVVPNLVSESSHVWMCCASWLLPIDKDGMAIIMCEAELEAKYSALVSGTTVIESSLHLNLSEHLNSEIGLGTITNVDSAKSWLKKSFLFRRVKKNPNHYSLGKNDDQTWEQRIDDLVQQSIEKLKETELIEHDGTTGSVSSTEYGDIMSKVNFSGAILID